jgi:hypothetical protein
MFTGRPPTIRPSRRGRGRVVVAPEKKLSILTDSTKIFTATFIVHLLRFGNQTLTE